MYDPFKFICRAYLKRLRCSCCICYVAFVGMRINVPYIEMCCLRKVVETFVFVVSEDICHCFCVSLFCVSLLLQKLAWRYLQLPLYPLYCSCCLSTLVTILSVISQLFFRGYLSLLLCLLYCSCWSNDTIDYYSVPYVAVVGLWVFVTIFCPLYCSCWSEDTCHNSCIRYIHAVIGLILVATFVPVILQLLVWWY